MPVPFPFRPSVIAACTAVLLAGCAASPPPRPVPLPEPARPARRHHAVFSVGNGVLWAEAGVGVAATQAVVDVSYGPQALALLREGRAPDEIVRTIWERDPNPRPEDWPKTGRQFAVMAADGRHAVYTGPDAPDWAGHARGLHVTAQGNILAGRGVVDSMVAAFERARGQHLAFRLVAALEAGQAAGGDTRGMQSAALVVVKKGGGVWLNNDVVVRVQVDDDPEPIAELRRLVTRAAQWNRRMRPLPPDTAR